MGKVGYSMGETEEIFRVRCKEQIKLRGEKQIYLFEALGYSSSYGYKVMNGYAKLTLPFMFGMADQLDSSLDYLCGRDVDINDIKF